MASIEGKSLLPLLESHSPPLTTFYGISFDNRTYCGVFYVPLNLPTVSPAPPCVGKLFEETLAKGVISLIATPSTLITGRAQGPLSCVNIETGVTYSIDTGAVLPADDSKVICSLDFPLAQTAD